MSAMKKAVVWGLPVFLGIPVLLVAVIAAQITVYPLVVPALSGVLPRPNIVPKRGPRADYHWKGSGIEWTWCEDVGGGSVHWSVYGGAAEVSLVMQPICRTFDGSRYSNPWDASLHAGHDEVLFRVPEGCRTGVSPERLGAYARLTQAALTRASNPEQITVLAEMKRRLLVTDGRALVTSSWVADACSNSAQPAQATARKGEGPQR